MKINKVILGVATAAVAIIGSFAFKANTNKKFGAGTLFSATNGCHRIDCQRGGSSNTCASATPYYTLSNCTGTQYTVALPVGL